MASERLEFGRYVLDLNRGALLLDGQEIALRPKTFAVLCYLVQHPDRLVSKDELIEDYLAGELSQNERRWLENHLLVSNDGRERHAFALTMERLQQPVPAVREVSRLTWFERFKSLFRTQPSAVTSGSSVALVQPWTLAILTSVVVVALIGFLVGPRMFSRGGGITFDGPTLASSQPRTRAR